VPNLATAYAAAHPDARPLLPTEEPSDDPELYATADFEVTGLHGPYLSYEHHTDIGLPDGSEVHSVRRGVIDLRTRESRSPGDLFGAREGKRVIEEGRRGLAAQTDSLLAMEGESARDLVEAMRELRFDPTSFGVERIGNDPAIGFLAPGEGEWAMELATPMTPIRVAAPHWWDEVRPGLPTSADANGDEIWARPTAGVLARMDSDAQVVTIVLLDSVTREWRAARVPAPVHRILWLDEPPLDSIARRALGKAYEDAALYSGDSRIARGPSTATRGEPAIRAVSLTSGGSRVRRGGFRARAPSLVTRSSP
jgi:hypothetical protein